MLARRIGFVPSSKRVAIRDSAVTADFELVPVTVNLESVTVTGAKGIAIYPVAASGVDKPTEFLFRAMAVMTGGKYVFLTDDSGVGDPHAEPDITGYTVEKLNDLIVREILAYVADRTVQRSVVNS